MNETVEKLKEMHFNNYKNALIENVKNNTNVLVNEDIMSLLKKPPLDSMDLIKNKFLDLAKKNKIILNTKNLDDMMEKYRNNLVESCSQLKDIRINLLNEKINSFEINSDIEIFKLTKKDFVNINKQIKKILKSTIKMYVEKNIFDGVDCLFSDNIDLLVKKKIIDEASKFINGLYQKQLLENVDFKILVKDTILINGIKEQGEHYLFTLNNSRIFN